MPTNPDALKQLLPNTPSTAPWRRRAWIAAAVLLLLASAGWFWMSSKQTLKPQYIAEPLARGDITLSVSANGTLQPVRHVNVGSELSGTVQAVRVDVNDRVKRGQVLIELDPAKLKDQVQHARAALAAAQAQRTQAEATAREAKAQLARLEEVFKQSQGGIPSLTDMDAARATAARSQAAVAGGGSLHSRKLPPTPLSFAPHGRSGGADALSVRAANVPYVARICAHLRCAAEPPRHARDSASWPSLEKVSRRCTLAP